jgi:hypothetical protein
MTLHMIWIVVGIDGLLRHPDFIGIPRNDVTHDMVCGWDWWIELYSFPACFINTIDLLFLMDNN